MRKKSIKKKRKDITTNENIVVSNNKKVCNLFKTKPELSVGWIDPDDINDFIKKDGVPEKEKSITRKMGLKDEIIDGKMTRGQAATEIKNKLRRKKEKEAVEYYKKSMKNGTYQGDGTQ
jgi:hypothetical protein